MKSMVCQATDNRRWLQSLCRGPGDERLSHLGLGLVCSVLLSSQSRCYQFEARQRLSVSGSLSAHMLAFGQAAIGGGSFPSAPSTCVTGGAFISAGDASRARLLIKRHGVTPPLSSVSLTHALIELLCRTT